VALWRSVDAARDEVLRTFPSGTRVSLPEGGFVLWVQLPDGFDGVEVASRAVAAGVAILPGAAFSANLQYRNYIRIACGYPADVLGPAILTIARLLTS
jgi:DNA-binding transcriptional MocR family regulator